jgi:hypothetical protein
VAVGFGLSADPLSVTITVGGSGQSTVNVSANGNPVTLPVNLSASSISGVSTDFDPQPVNIPPSGGQWHYNLSTLTISAGGSATPGVYDLTVYADFGITIRNVTITLTILGSEGDTVVGGEILPVDKLMVLAPRMALTGLVDVLVVCIVVVARKKRQG